MKTKKILALALGAVCVFGMLAGCGKQETGTVSTDGSTSMEKVIGSLKETFEAENEGITVTYNPTGSGTGITAVAEGRCDIGLSSRDLKDEEKAKGLEGTVIAYDGIAIIVNPENTVDDLTIEDIAKIYTGEIKNWKEVGGKDAVIVLIGRELTSTGDVITTVAGNPAAIGYASLASVKDSVKALKVGGVTPSETTIKDGSYKVQRNFVLVTKTEGKLSDAAQKFFDYITSSDASEVIRKAGAVPVK